MKMWCSKHLRLLRFKLYSVSQHQNHLKVWETGKGNLGFNTRTTPEHICFITFYLFVVCACMFVCGCAHAMTPVWRSEGNLRKSLLVPCPG